MINRMYLWRYNITMIRLLRARPDFDISHKRNLRWREILYCTLRMWPLVIRSKLDGVHVPSGVVFIGGRLTQKDVDWARNKAVSLGLARE